MIPRVVSMHPELAGVAQVFARDTRLHPDAPLVFLERGHAPIVRPDARAGHLICPLPSCPSPALTTRGGSRRDHFAHMAGSGGHAKETLAHHTSKHLMARWLRSRLPEDSSIVVDRDEVENGQRPDVLVTLADGVRVAYEVQFAALTPAEWLRRHRGYRGQGIRDVWLFGGSRHVRQPRISYPSEGELEMTVLLATVLGDQHPLLLIDPFGERVALGTGRRAEALLGGSLAYGSAGYLPRWLPLEDVPESHGMPLLPGWLGMKKAAAARRAEQEQALRERRAWLEPLEQAWDVARAELLERAALRPEVLELIERGDLEERTSRYLGHLAAHWRWLIFETCPSLQPGAVVNFRAWADALADRLEIPRNHAQQSDRRLHAGVAVMSFLPALRRAGWVHYDGRSANPDVLILASFDAPPTPALLVAIREKRWSWDGDALQLRGEDSNTVLLTFSPAPSVLPPPLTRRKPKAVSAMGRRFDAELRALGSGPLTSSPVPVPTWVEASMAGDGPLNFVDHIHRGVRARRNRSAY